MDDIAEEDYLARLIRIHQSEKPLGGILADADRQKLAVMAMRPDVAEMEVGHDERARLFDPHRAPRVEPKARLPVPGGYDPWLSISDHH